MHSLKVSPDDIDSNQKRFTGETEDLTVPYLDMVPSPYMGWPAGGADDATERQAGPSVNDFLKASSAFAAAMAKDLTASAKTYRTNETNSSLRARGIQEN